MAAPWWAPFAAAAAGGIGKALFGGGGQSEASDFESQIGELLIQDHLRKQQVLDPILQQLGPLLQQRLVQQGPFSKIANPQNIRFNPFGNTKSTAVAPGASSFLGMDQLLNAVAKGPKLTDGPPFGKPTT